MSDSSETGFVHVDNFVQEWTNAGIETELAKVPSNFEDFIKVQMSIPHDMVKELGKVCGEHTLTDKEEEVDPSELLKYVPPSVGLVTTGLQRAELERREKFPKYKRGIKHKLKYLKADGPGMQHSRNMTLLVSTADNVKKPTALLSVFIYRPFVHSFNSRAPILSEVYHILSCQTLATLRDKIQCSADKTILGEFSNNPDMPKDVRAKDMYKSGFFFINGTFYNDTRDPDCRDYSQTITEWAKDPKRCVGPYHVRKMEEATFGDLELQPGVPYLYMHQGNCEHLMVFSDVRILHPEEVQDLTMYPLMVADCKDRLTKCRLCLMHRAKWITQGSPVTPEDPCFFCDTCFRAMHYDEQGKKVMEFRAYPYQQDDT